MPWHRSARAAWTRLQQRGAVGGTCEVRMVRELRLVVGGCLGRSGHDGSSHPVVHPCHAAKLFECLALHGACPGPPRRAAELVGSRSTGQPPASPPVCLSTPFLACLCNAPTGRATWAATLPFPPFPLRVSTSAATAAAIVNSPRTAVSATKVPGERETTLQDRCLIVHHRPSGARWRCPTPAPPRSRRPCAHEHTL